MSTFRESGRRRIRSRIQLRIWQLRITDSITNLAITNYAICGSNYEFANYGSRITISSITNYGLRISNYEGGNVELRITNYGGKCRIENYELRGCNVELRITKGGQCRITNYERGAMSN